MSFIYAFEVEKIIEKRKTDESTNINVSTIIKNEHEILSLESLTYHISTTNASGIYSNYSYNITTQNLIVQPSINDWITFNFNYDGGIKNGFSLKFDFYNCKVAIQTCLFKCGQCSNSFDKCDNGTCKLNFTLFEDDEEKGCYPNDQNFPHYIFNKTNDKFKKCFNNCEFCSLEKDFSSNSAQNCIICEDGYLKSYKYPGNCYRYEFPQNYSNYSKNVGNINDENFTIVESCNKYLINSTGECIDSCPNQTVWNTYKFNDTLNFSNQEESNLGLLYTLEKEKPPKFLFNKVCYSNCPKLTYEDTNNSVCKCSYGWHYNSTTEEKICYNEKDYCLSLDYYYHTDDKECVLNNCKSGYSKINFECYKDKCPENSKQISSNVQNCESNLKYCYIDEHYKTKCSNDPFSRYNLKFNDTHTYFQSCNDSLYYFNIKTYLYNKTCYQYCPEETITNKTNNKCSCKYYIYYLDKEASDYECLKEKEKCRDKNRYNITDKKLCVATQQECLDLGYNIYNDECRDECPENTQKDSDGDVGICLCKYYYYNDSNILDCFEEGITCENKNYPIKSDSDTIKECFKTIKDCLSKNHLYYYDQNCYKSNCPSDKIPLNILPQLNRTKIINELNIEEFYRDKLCICDTSNIYKGWIAQETNPSVQECLIDCPEYYDIDPITHKCFYSCDPKKDYIFNNICYKNQCPEGTYLQNPDSVIRTCICKDKSEIIDINSALTACEFNNPDLFYTDRNNCPYVYNYKCYFQCPQNTCLTTITKELVNCVDYKNNMKIYNSICIEGIREYVKTLESIENDDDIIPIITPSGVVLNAFSSEADIEKLIDKYPNLTFVDLGECKDKLIESYNLLPLTKIYIIGIDTPNLYGNSSINVFNYELYLKNGTQLDNLSSCDRLKIILSSNINDLDLVKFYKAKDFYEEDKYDIYNKSDIFYIDRCASAEDEGNDITLEDRFKYYYPNVSICNEGCIYKQVDYKKKRFVCNCNANLTKKYNYIDENEQEYINNENIKEEDEDNGSYIDYLLSLINYEIFACANLFLKFNYFYKNAGFYIGFITLISCIVLFFIFWIKGIKHIRLIMYRNIPTKKKLREIIRKQEERHQRMLNQNINNTINDIKHINIEEIDIPKKLNISNSFKDFKYQDIFSKNLKINKDYNDINNQENTCSKFANSNSALKEYKNINFHDYISSKNINSNNNKNTNDPSNKNNNEYPKYSLFLKKINFGKYGEKEVEIYNIYKTRKKSNSIKIPKKYIREKNPIINKRKNTGYYSSKENKLKSYYINNEEKSVNQKESNNNIDINNLNQNNNNQNQQNKSLKLSLNEDNDSKELFNSSKLNKSINKRNTVCLNKNKINYDLIYDNHKYDNASTNLKIKGKMKEDLELNIDLNFTHLIDRNDDEIENRELNNIPYRQALRIDKRSFFEIFISVFTNEVDLLSLFFYRNPYSHYSLYVSIYLYDLLMDLTMNCFLYTDDVVSEKYHNNGQLSMITSFSLSLMSNIISSIIVFIISKLTNYCDIIEEIIKNVKYKRNYFENIIRLFKYIKIRLGIFYFLHLVSLLLMTYYSFVFCAVYRHSQGSIFINYLIGTLISLATSTGLTIIITLLRAISIKYRLVVLFNVSKYLYEHF